jgi:integrase
MPRRKQGPKLRWINDRTGWYIVWTERGRSRKRSTGKVNREEAEAILGEWLRTRTRKPRSNRPQEVLVTDVLSDYGNERGLRVVAPRAIGCAIEALLSYWTGMTVAEVTPRTCEQYVMKRAKAANTVRRELNVLQTAINYAFQTGRLNRRVSVVLPQAPQPRDRWLTRKEAAGLLRATLRSQAVRLYLPLFILIALYTGRRKEAILSLRWSQVDLDKQWINFDHGRRTNKRRGRIPIPPRLIPHLRRARRRGTELGYVIHRDGERIGDLKKGFAAACERARLLDVTPHVLKHTAITWAMQNAIDPWQAVGFFATSLPTLMRVYGHHHPEHMREAAKAVCKRPGVSKMGA